MQWEGGGPGMGEGDVHLMSFSRGYMISRSRSSGGMHAGSASAAAISISSDTTPATQQVHPQLSKRRQGPSLELTPFLWKAYMARMHPIHP